MQAAGTEETVTTHDWFLLTISWRRRAAGRPRCRPTGTTDLIRESSNQVDVAEVLWQFAIRPLGWVEIYKVFATIKASIKPVKLDTTGWVTRKDLSRLTENCNRPELGGPTARHARLAGHLGSDPPTITDHRDHPPVGGEPQLTAVGCQWLPDSSPDKVECILALAWLRPMICTVFPRAAYLASTASRAATEEASQMWASVRSMTTSSGSCA